MSSQKHTPLTFPCCSTVHLQTGMRSMNGDRRACHPGQCKAGRTSGMQEQKPDWSREAAAAESTRAPTLHTCKRQGLFHPSASSLHASLRVFVQVIDADHAPARCKVRIPCTARSCIFALCLLSVWPKRAFSLKTRPLPGICSPDCLKNTCRCSHGWNR